MLTRAICLFTHVSIRRPFALPFAAVLLLGLFEPAHVDFSIIKNTKIGEEVRLQFRVEFFDLFNHANFGRPGNVVGSPAFGRITNTRFPTGESGSSRQAKFASKLIF
jgi:hypothetical protein